MDILYVSGKDNSGKTTAMLMALDTFVKTQVKQIGAVSIIDVKRPQSILSGKKAKDLTDKISQCLASPIPRDIGCILKMPNHTVGILTEGDSRKTIRKFVELFDKGNHCDIAIMAITIKINNVLNDLRQHFICCKIAETTRIHGNKSNYKMLWPQEVQRVKNLVLGIMNQKCL